MTEKRNPFDPSRFILPTDPTSACHDILREWDKADLHGERKVHSQSRDPAVAGTADASMESSEAVGIAHEIKPADWSRKWHILISLCALLLGMWCGPFVVGKDGLLPRAITKFQTYSSSSMSVLAETRRPTPHIPPHISSFVQNAIYSALRDPVGRRDFALAAEGARIAPKLTTSFPDTPESRPPANILDEDLRSGSCWSIPDDHAQVSVKLRKFIYPTHVTIDHVPREIAANIQEAPRHMVLWGVVDGQGNYQRREDAFRSLQQSSLHLLGEGPPIRAGGTFVPLAAFEYDINAPFHVQTFPVDPAVIASRMYFGIMVLEIKENWGAESTRIYRVRVHGDEVNAS